MLFAFESKRGHNGVVLKRFDFDSQLFRMSTIARGSLDDDVFIYTKGSPEAMLSIFHRSSVPENYHQMLKYYASQGFRILAIGSRRLKKT